MSAKQRLQALGFCSQKLALVMRALQIDDYSSCIFPYFNTGFPFLLITRSSAQRQNEHHLHRSTLGLPGRPLQYSGCAVLRLHMQTMNFPVVLLQEDDNRNYCSAWSSCWMVNKHP